MSSSYFKQLPHELLNIIHTYLNVTSFGNFDRFMETICNYRIDYEILFIIKYSKLYEFYKEFSKYYKLLNRYENAKWRILYEDLTNFNKDENKIIEMCSGDIYVRNNFIDKTIYNSLTYEFIEILTIYQHDRPVLNFIKYFPLNNKVFPYLKTLINGHSISIYELLDCIESKLKEIFNNKENLTHRIKLNESNSINGEDFMTGCYLILCLDISKKNGLEIPLRYIIDNSRDYNFNIYHNDRVTWIENKLK